MHCKTWWLAGLLVLASGAEAQLTLFEHDNYRGRRLDIYQSTKNMPGGFNDLVSSVTVRGGQWQVCDDIGYSGRCVTLTDGNYPSLRSLGMTNTISSARLISGSGGQARPPGGGGGGAFGARIVLYDGYSFSGRSITIERETSNLDRAGFNDRALSAVVQGGTWTICEHADFRGSCETLGPGRYASLGGMSQRISSLRAADFGGSGSGPGYPPVWGRNARVIFYEGPNFEGRQFVVDQNRIDNLGGTGFNDRASSMRVERGYWMFCSDANFGGECRTFGPGDYADLPYGLNNRISSGRRISEQYPYSQSPVWGNP